MLTRKYYILLNAYHIINDGFFDAVPVLLTFIVLSFGCGEKEIGIIVSLGTALSTITGLATLILVKYLSPLRVISLLIGICGFCFLAASFANNIFFIGLCFVLSVGGYYIFHNISFSYITENTDRSKLGRLLSDFTAIGDIGRIPFVAFAGFVSAYSFLGFPGWRIVCLGYGTMGICAAIWLLIFTRKNSYKQEEQVPSHNNLPSFGLLKKKNIFLPIIASTLNAFSNEKIFTFLPLLLLYKGFEPSIIGSFAVGFTFGSFVGKMACGRLVDKFGPRYIFITAEFLLAIFLFFIIILNNIFVIIFVSLLIGILTKGTVPVIQSIITEPLQHSGNYREVFSIDSFIRGITNIITPLLFGFIASIWNINLVYAIMAIVALCSIFPVFIMKKNK